jgi:DNA-binding response OmpR family regulator
VRVLCVEDDVTTARSLALMCQMAGHSCDTTGLGEEAVELGKRGGYDIIILDMMLPDIDGFQVIGRLRSAGIQTPVLIQSGLIDRDNRLRDTLPGNDDVLAKPFTKSELMDRMQAVIARARQAPSMFEEDEPDDQDALWIDASERRNHRRFSTLKTGEIILKDGKPPLACLILNLSYGGAEVRLPDESLECPSTFALKLQAGPVHSCEVCWRRGDKVGVRFT